MPTPDYAELHCISNFTFLRGASHPEELVQQAATLGYRALALTDECSLAGVVRAWQEAKRHPGFKLIIGAEFCLDDGLRLLLLAPDRQAYGDLSMLISAARRAAPKGQYQLARSDIEAVAAGLLAIWLPPSQPVLADGTWLAEIFPQRCWIALERLLLQDDDLRLQQLRQLGLACQLPLVACGDVHMHLRRRRPLQDVLTAIRLGTTVARAGSALFANAERYLRRRQRLVELYPPDLLAATLEIAERCQFDLGSLRYEYPAEIVPDGLSPTTYLRQLTQAGLLQRFGAAGPSAAVVQQVEHELHMIAQLQYEPFFLTVHDIVQWASSQDILCQGRGSAANSVVCFALGITEVHPELTDLLFERFISRERNEPPDIDVDFEHERREEVIQYIYRKYGRDRAALAAALITYRTRSAVRDVGKALGLGLEQVDRLAKSLAWWDGRQMLPERMQEVGLDPDASLTQQMLQLVAELIGFPRHLSQHVGGFVISRGPLARLVPVENAAMADRTVIEWDKHDLDALGLLKVDILALGMLSALRKALQMVNSLRGSRLTLATLPREDAAVYQMISRADTVGVFQIESRAQMSMLPRMRPACFYDLVIEVSIVRPGPIQGGMVHPYLRRRQGLEPVDYAGPEVQQVLQRTLGVPIFQEQVMKIAVLAAGFTPGEADELRRSMAAWRRSGKLAQYQQKLVSGLLERGYSQEFADRLFQQILGFSEYGFPESHAASFALLVYASSWLKHYEPAAFCCALLNSQPMGFYRPSQLIQDAQRHQVQILPVDVCLSDWDSSLEPGVAQSAQPAIRLGLRMVAGLARQAAQRLLTARQTQPFADAADLQRRAQLGRKDLDALAAADALLPLLGNRRLSRWQVAGLEALPPLLQNTTIEEPQPDLFAESAGEQLLADYRALGLSLRAHPLGLLRSRLQQQRILPAAQLNVLPHGRLARACGLVIGRQRPGSANGVLFVTLEDETGVVNVVIWSAVLERFRRAILGSHLLTIYGQLQREGEVVHLLASHCLDHSKWLAGLNCASRDFH